MILTFKNSRTDVRNKTPEKSHIDFLSFGLKISAQFATQNIQIWLSFNGDLTL